MKFNYYTLKNNDGSALAECCEESLQKTIWNKNKAKCNVQQQAASNIKGLLSIWGSRWKIFLSHIKHNTIYYYINSFN